MISNAYEYLAKGLLAGSRVGEEGGGRLGAKHSRCQRISNNFLPKMLPNMDFFFINDQTPFYFSLLS